jgi:hypothetical protein
MKHESKPAAGQMRAKRSVRKPKPKSALAEKRVEPKSSREKVRAYRERMRAKGLRLVQMWVPDTETRDAGGEKQGSSPRRRRGSAALRKAWADALTPLPHGPAKTFEDIADLVGSVDGLPSDLGSNKDKYLRAGYGRKRHR